MMLSVSKTHRETKRARKVRTAALFVQTSMAALALAGCRNGFDDDATRVAGWTQADHTQRHPIIVSRQPQTLNLAISEGSERLAPVQRAELMNFAQHSRASDSGNSRLVISVPGGSANEVSAMNATQEIRALLIDNGFDDSAIQVEAYGAEGSRHAPIKVSYMRYVAEGPVCGNINENLAINRENLPHPDLGCTTQRNLAAMIANPADLVSPRSETARISDRRDATWQKYVKGEPTGASRSEDEKISTSGSK